MLEYDETEPISIEKYGKKLIGMTFADVCDQDDIKKSNIVRETADYEIKHENKKRKGGLGEIIEERYFHYQSNNDARPDFDKAGVELKVTPYKQNKNGSFSAKERLILTMIDYFKVVDEDFEKSHMWQKSKLILLVYYLYQKEIKNRLDYKIGHVNLFTPPEEDIKIIRQDFEVIKRKIKVFIFIPIDCHKLCDNSNQLTHFYSFATFKIIFHRQLLNWCCLFVIAIKIGRAHV